MGTSRLFKTTRLTRLCAKQEAHSDELVFFPPFSFFGSCCSWSIGSLRAAGHVPLEETSAKKAA